MLTYNVRTVSRVSEGRGDVLYDILVSILVSEKFLESLKNCGRSTEHPRRQHLEHKEVQDNRQHRANIRQLLGAL